MEAVGTVADAASESRFRFLVHDAKLRRMDYVQLALDEGPALAQVVAVAREKGDLVATAGVIGSRDARGVLVGPKAPLRPGDKVARADERLIASVLGLGEQAGSEAGAYVGLLRGHAIRVHLDIDVLVQKHVSVLAKTGAGKSYVVGVLIEELLRRGVPVVIVDPHGEYASLAEPNNAPQELQNMRRFAVKPRGYAHLVQEYSPDARVNPGAQPLQLDGTGLGMRELTTLMGGKVSSVQLGLLHQAVKRLAAKRGSYLLADLIAEVQRMEASAKWPLLGALQYLDGLGLFAERGTPVTSLVQRGQATVLNLRGSAPDVQEIVVAWVAKALFEARKLDRVPPLMLVVEEAHHFCPERGFTQAVSSDTLRTIASEGRKFGLGLCVVSQRPAKVDKNVLSQANTQLILKVTNPNDLKAITASVEGLGPDAEDEIQMLPVGTALVSHPRFPMPVEVEVRPRETRHGGKSVRVVEAGAGEEDEEPAGPGPGGTAPSAALAARAEGPGDAAKPLAAEARGARGAGAHGPAAPEAGPGEMEPFATEAASRAPLPLRAGEVPAVQDLRELFRRVLHEELHATPDANLEEVLRILEGRAATLRGLRAEFPGSPEVEELDRLHRAAAARVRLALRERRRRGAGLRRRRGARGA